MSISKNIVKLRSVFDVSQKELAHIAGVSRSAVAHWESGQTTPRMTVLQTIADHFGITKANLLEDNGMDNVRINTQTSTGNNNVNIQNNYDACTTDQLNEYEKDIIQIFRTLPIRNQAEVISTLHTIQEQVVGSGSLQG